MLTGLDKRNLQRKLQLFSTFIAGVGEQYQIFVSFKSSESYYSKDKRIFIGLETAVDVAEDESELLAVGKALVAHEISHYRNTDWVEDKDIPFALINIFEDARIEHLIVEQTGIEKLREYFDKLHSLNFDAYYQTDESYYNFANHIILLRWGMWSRYVEEEYKKRLNTIYSDLEEYLQAKYPNRFLIYYFTDCREYLQKSLNCYSTEELVEEVVKPFYEKWEKLFEFSSSPCYTGTGELDSEATSSKRAGREEVDEEEMNKKLEQAEAESSSSSSEDSNEDGKESNDIRLLFHPEYEKEATEFFRSLRWDWDEKLLSSLRDRLRRWRVRSRSVVRDYSLSGKRVSPRRIAQKKLEVLKVDREVVKEPPKLRLLFVIDGSGSMDPGNMKSPFYYASHLALAMKDEVGADVCICNDWLSKPILIRDFSSLRRYYYSWGEGLRIVEPLLSKYDYVVFFTDAQVSRSDWGFLNKHKHKFVFVYTADRNDCVDVVKKTCQQLTHRHIVLDSIELAAQELGLLLRRLR